MTQALSEERRELLVRLMTDETKSAAQPDVEAPPEINQIAGKDAFPLSFAQQRLWFLDQLEPGNPFYNFPLAVPFDVPVNVTVLERSINALVRRHEVLRTVFGAIDDKPMQVVLPELKVPLTVVDLQGLGAEAQEAEITRLGAELAQHPFDLAEGPLLRTVLLRRGRDRHVLLLVLHHIVSDGWSLGIFWRELVSIYNAFYINKPSPLPELPIQYADFAVWQRGQLQGDRLKELVSYWREQLAGIPPLDLPTDRPRPPVLSYRGAFCEIVLPMRLAHALRDLSNQEGATLFMTLYAAFAVLLHRYIGQEDIAVGTYVASRDQAELEDLIGFFVNTLVLRVDLSGDPSFRETLGRVRKLALDAYAHQELPFEKLVEELHPERDLGRNPLFQVSFQLFSARRVRDAPEAAPTIDVHRGMAIFDMAVNIWDGPDGLSGHVEYSTDLFEPETVARMVEHFRILLTGLVADPDAALSRLPLLSTAERSQLLDGWNQTAAPIPPDCIHQAFEAEAGRSPDSVAIVAGGVTWTYDALNSRANRLAHHLAGQGIGAGKLVAVCAERGVLPIVGILAVLKTGAAYVPLDPCFPAERLAFMLADCNAAAILCDTATAGRLPADPTPRIALDDEPLLAGHADTNPGIAVERDSACYVIYTSGSTGKPKGVVGTHLATMNRFQWMWTAYPFSKGEVLCQKTTLSFVDSVWEVFGGLLQGLPTLVLGEEAIRDPDAMVTALSEAKVSRIVLIPSMLRALIASGIDLAARLPELKLWTLSGEALPADLLEDFRQMMPEATVLNLYGSSEVAADVLYCDLSRTAVHNQMVPIGRPIANTAAYILDQNLNLVPTGVPGELYICGAGLARGYLNRPDLTAEAFLPNPFSGAPGDRLYRTRDRARYRQDGQIEYLGRVDGQVKIRGHRVELGEIETVLAEHPLVAEAVATVAETGDSASLVVYVVPAEAEDSRASDPARQLASHWQTVWDETYAGGGSGRGAFNTVGWNSSYTDEPFAPQEMREWVDQTVDRVLSFRPRRVLEIGCGTGLILLRVAPECEHYVGTDFSAIALDQVRAEIGKAPERYGHVRLEERDALDLDGLGGPFDLVVLNSVVQYFPDVDYLTRIIDAALSVVALDGALLIGDVRSLPLLPAFHAAVELQRSSDKLPLETFRARIQKQCAQEKELAIDPIYFQSFGSGVGQVTVDLRRGRRSNEMVQFRYDVTMRRPEAPRAGEPEHWLEWNREVPSVAALRELLAAGAEIIGITGIPNARTRGPIRALELIEGGGFATLGDLHVAIVGVAEDAVDPEDLWELGEELGYDTAVGLQDSGADGRFAVVFTRSAAAAPGSFGFAVTASQRNGEANSYVTNPTAAMERQRMVSDLRTYLEGRLAPIMVPAAIIFLDQLPLTPSGKIDRRALASPDFGFRDVSTAFRAPRSPTEETLARMWTDLLNIERVGIFDSFFELGGHSLLATQLISRIRNEFESEVAVKAIFESPTIAALAAKIDERQGAGLQRVPARRSLTRLDRDVGATRS